jgi:ATP-binding cassette subfamily B protein
VLRAGIELRDVWFRYGDGQPWVLRGLNLTIPHGGSLALVGLNGAGKSTVVKLLCRFYDPSRGAILWDGVDLRDVPVEELRSRIGAVFQDYMCYDLSAAENVGLGDVSYLDDRERVVEAARRAGAHTIVTALPKGYDTLLSRMFFDEADKDDPETGVLLSGGQWQRIALARAFLRDRRDLMILDEPSAGLDAEAEHEVHTSLRRHRDGATSVLISHRLGAVRDANLIAVLSGGRLAELGTHEELIAAAGEYARLFRLQASGYDEVVQR